jgi:hypothetical protein
VAYLLVELSVSLYIYITNHSVYKVKREIKPFRIFLLQTIDFCTDQFTIRQTKMSHMTSNQIIEMALAYRGMKKSELA